MCWHTKSTWQVYSYIDWSQKRLENSQTLIELFWEATNGPNKLSHLGRGTDPFLSLLLAFTRGSRCRPLVQVSQILTRQAHYVKYGQPSVEGFILLHARYDVMVDILLFNFPITIFSDTNDKVSSNKEVAYVKAIEYRIPTSLWPLLDEWRCRYFVLS